jgi:steroid delta-isomerase-like uncharacterized protein
MRSRRRRREATIDELFAKDGVAYGLGEGEAEVHGPAEFKPFVRNLRGSFPDFQIGIHDTMAEDDKVTVRVLLEGTHSGPGLGVPPTGRRIRISGIVIIRISKGLFVEAWNSWDQLGLLRQIGALPAVKGEDQFLTQRRAPAVSGVFQHLPVLCDFDSIWRTTASAKRTTYQTFLHFLQRHPFRFGV